MSIVIKNGRIINPSDRMDTVADLKVIGDRVDKIACSIPPDDGDEVIDASGCWVMPGFIDMHVHLRDPGQTHKETIETGMDAAANGGFTTIVSMGNTIPAVDSVETYSYVMDKAQKKGTVTVLQAGTITKGLSGEELSDIEGLVKAGCRVFSEDGKSVMNSALMRHAMQTIEKAGGIILDHCEDKPLVEGGVVNATEAARLGVNGISNAVEDIIAVRDIMLARETGVRLHLCHCSTKAAEEYLYRAKQMGVRVSGEVCPHHFTLCCEDIPDKNDANYKMNPPLRTRADVEALRDGISKGVFDCISTDHAPHTENEKSGGFEKAPFGIVGLETCAALTNTVLVNGGYLTPMGMAARMSYGPAQVLGIDRGDISIGSIADIVVFNPKAGWVVDPDKFKSKGRNTPFTGKTLYGAVVNVIHEGCITK